MSCFSACQDWSTPEQSMVFQVVQDHPNLLFIHTRAHCNILGSEDHLLLCAHSRLFLCMTHYIAAKFAEYIVHIYDLITRNCISSIQVSLFVQVYWMVEENTGCSFLSFIIPEHPWTILQQPYRWSFYRRNTLCRVVALLAFDPNVDVILTAPVH